MMCGKVALPGIANKTKNYFLQGNVTWKVSLGARHSQDVQKEMVIGNNPVEFETGLITVADYSVNIGMAKWLNHSSKLYNECTEQQQMLDLFREHAITEKKTWAVEQSRKAKMLSYTSWTYSEAVVDWLQ